MTQTWANPARTHKLKEHFLACRVFHLLGVSVIDTRVAKLISSFCQFSGHQAPGQSDRRSESVSVPLGPWRPLTLGSGQILKAVVVLDSGRATICLWLHVSWWKVGGGPRGNTLRNELDLAQILDFLWRAVTGKNRPMNGRDLLAGVSSVGRF